jgi:hypothetical protein
MTAGRRLWLPRRAFLCGGAASLAFTGHAQAQPPATIASGKPIGRGQMLVVSEDAAGRIVALDSSCYLGPHKTLPTDVIVVGSYCGTRILAPMFSRGVKAVIATDAGIGKDNAGISGLLHGETIGVPVAVIAAKSAETSNGRETLLLGTISRANKQAQALGVTTGMIAYEAGMRLAKAPAGKATPTPLGKEEKPVVVEVMPKGRIWATPGTTAIREKIPNDVVCSGANSSRVSSDGVLRMGAKGSIANDAGVGRNNTAIEALTLLAEKGVPSAAVGTMSARLGEGLSTWNDGVISFANAPAMKLGVKAGMTAKEAARLMLG